MIDQRTLAKARAAYLRTSDFESFLAALDAAGLTIFARSALLALIDYTRKANTPDLGPPDEVDE